METPQEKVQNASGKRLELKLPFGRAGALAILLAVLCLVGGEVLLRSSFFTRHLPLPSYGIGHQNLDLKFAELQALLREGSLPSCIFLGSSVVDTDIDPERFSAVVLQESGVVLDCYNFGIGGLILPSVYKVAQVIKGLGGGGLLVMGITPLDFEERNVRIPWQRSQEQIDASPWLRFRLGEYSFSGWLTDRSHVYRYFLRFRQWMESPRLSLGVGIKERSSRRGFNNWRRFTKFGHSENKVEKIRKKLARYQVSEKRIDLLGQIAAAWGAEETVFAEMPLHPVLHDVFPGGGKGYREPLERAAASLGRISVPLVRVDEQTFSQRVLWRDYYHLNSMGALRYTDWLASRVAANLNGGGRPLPAGLP